MTAVPSFTRKYNVFAKALHWGIFLLIAAQFAIAWTMPHIHKGVEPVGLIAWHLGVGVAILLLVGVRLVWRLVKPPVTTGVEAGKQRLVAAATFGALYLMMLVVPVLGWANASSRGWDVGLGQALVLPKIMETGSALGHDLGDIHGDLAIALLVLVGLHVAAALFHHLVAKDDTLTRMR